MTAFEEVMVNRDGMTKSEARDERRRMGNEIVSAIEDGASYSEMIEMKYYCPMAIVYEEHSEPWLWAPNGTMLTLEEARDAFRFITDNLKRRIIVSWIQEYDETGRTDMEIKYYVNACGLSNYGFAIERMKNDEEI